MTLIFVVNLAAAWFLTGLIWTIQIVHYPLFGCIGERFIEYEERHCRRIGYIVGPVMLVELAAAILLVWSRPTYVSTSTAIISLGLVAVIWISTAALQAPCHRSLSRGFDAAIERRLVVSNWIRTLAWTARALLLTASLLSALSDQRMVRRNQPEGVSPRSWIAIDVGARRRGPDAYAYRLI